MTQAWHAPIAVGPVHASVRVPGSKSITNRALVLAALADGPSTLGAPLRGRDTLLMVEALRSLGVGITEVGHDWRVEPALLQGPATVDCGLAGTIMRFLPPVAALAEGRVDFDGDEQARRRPMGAVLEALRELGAVITGYTLPFTVFGAGSLPGGEVTLDASASSQFVSGLLLAAARYDAGVTVRHRGAPVPSRPHIEMTVDMLRSHGVAVQTEDADRWRVEPGPIRARDLRVEPDLSNATVFLAAAAVTGGEVRVHDWPRDTTQPGDGFRPILEALGCRVRRDGDDLVVRGGELSGVDLDLRDLGELTPTVAALCAVAGSRSTLRGIAHLRGHETDRLAALANEINILGGAVTETGDGLVIEPRPLRSQGRPWRSYADHRMATAGAVLGLVVPGMTVDDIGCTDKTLPNFPAMWRDVIGG